MYLDLKNLSLFANFFLKLMNKPNIYLFFLLSVLLTSCVPTKDLIYLQNKNDGATTVVTPSNQKPYRLQTNDLLNINIKAIDPQMVEIFNPTGGQSIGIGGEQGNYINGYSVDDHAHTIAFILVC